MDLLEYIDRKVLEIRNSLAYYNKAYRETPDDSYYKKSYKRTINLLEGRLDAYRDIRNIYAKRDNKRDK